MSAPRPTAATTTRPSPTGGAGPAPGGNGGGGILVPGGPGTGGPSPSPSPISTALIGDTRGWVCDSTGTCGKGISATTIAALTVIGAIALLAIAGTMVWVRMRTKRDVNVGMAQKERRDRYTRRGSRARSRSRGQNTLQRIINKQNGSEHELRSVNVDNQQQQDPFGYMKQTAAPEQFIAPPPQGQVNPMKPPVGFAPQPQPFAQPVVMMGGPAPPGYSMAPPQGQMPPPPPQQQFGPPPGGMYMQGPPPPQQQFRQ